jgi:Sorting nexin C terminal/PX domain
VKAGSAKSATKARTDAQLRPTLRLLDFARDRSREKQEKLLRDLKLGMNHIDREQLRRNALLSPRYPTEILSLQVSIEKALPAKDANIRISGNPQSTVFKIRCVATVGLVSEEIPSEILAPYLARGHKPAETYKETWVVYRPFREFQALHKHLKSQVAASESSGTAGSRLVGAAAAAFTAGAVTPGNRNRQRNALIPSLGQAQKAGALGVTQRALTKRMELLDGYLHHLLANGNQLSRSPEVLLFIGAFFPLSSDVLVGKLPISPLHDPLGRAEMAREALKLAPIPRASLPTSAIDENDELEGSAHSGDAACGAGAKQGGGKETAVDAGDEANKDTKAEKVVMTNPVIVNKIEKVPLGQVRNRIFELLSYQFGFENASFFRSRMLSALKTMSFAVTTPADFQKTLYKVHCEQASADALAYWINYGIEMLWPGGVFYESSPALTPEQQAKLAATCRELLHNSFPEQLRTVLGQDLTRDGLDMLHEMLQNRLVMKSMFYMLFDLLWEEIFPEMKDVLSGGEALDINFDEED